MMQNDEELTRALQRNKGKTKKVEGCMDNYSEANDTNLGLNLSISNEINNIDLKFRARYVLCMSNINSAIIITFILA
jgi:hypothetical protein